MIDLDIQSETYGGFYSFLKTTDSSSQSNIQGECITLLWTDNAGDAVAICHEVGSVNVKEVF